MSWLRELGSRVKGLFRQKQSEKEISEEIRLHLDMLTEENYRRGMKPQEARRHALLAFGGPTQTKEAYRRRSGVAVVETTLQDLRFGFRMLRRSPGFTAIALATLALGIGANSTTFSIVNRLLLQPLPYKDPDRLMAVFGALPAKNMWYSTVSPPDFRALRERNRSLESLSGFYTRSFNISDNGQPDRIEGTVVSWEFFRTFGMEPLLGRTFLSGEEQWGAHRVVVVSEAFWRTGFDADPNIVGKVLRLNGEPYSVIGVAPEAFDSSPSDKVWVPMSWAPHDDMDGRDNDIVNMVGRLDAGVTEQQARADLNMIMSELAKEFPEDEGFGANLRPLREARIGGSRRPLLFLLASVGVVLLIASVNVANLMLARTVGRYKELAVRSALGAMRFRLVQQFVIESLLLSCLGGAFGIALAYFLLRLTPLASSSIISSNQVHIDARVLLFTLAISVFAGLLCALVPALRASHVELGTDLKEGGRGVSLGKGHSRIRATLVVGELALALTLLTVAALSIRGLIRLLGVDPGFDTANLLTFTVDLPASYDPSAYHLMLNGASPQETAFYTELLARIEAIPGVEGAGAISHMPFYGNAWPKYFTPLDRALPSSIDQVPIEQYRPVGGHYFQTARIPLRKGRFLDEHDQHDAAPVIVISEAFARRYWPGQDPLGKEIVLDPPQNLVPASWLPPGYHLPTATIVGVVGDVRYAGLNSEAAPLMYAPFVQQDTFLNMAIMVRTKRDPTAIVASVRSIVKQLDPAQPIANVETMDRLVSRSMAGFRLVSMLLGSFGGIAVLLAAIGIYGLMAYFAGQRTNEIGIRMALGAGRLDILAMMVKNGFRLVSIGLGLGMLLSLFVTRVISQIVFGVANTDPALYCGTVIGLGTVAMIACFVPALRAANVDPIIALRRE